jgi:integrase
VITERQITKAIRAAPARAGRSITLTDDGERGAGRLALIVRAHKSRVTAEWYARYYLGGKRSMAKLGSYPALPLVEARAKFLTDYAPTIKNGGAPTSAMVSMSKSKAGTLGALFTAYVDSLEQAGKRSAKNARYMLNKLAREIGAGRPASSILPGDIVPCLAAIHARGAGNLALATRTYILAAFNFGLRAENDYTRKNAGTTWGLTGNPAAAIPPDSTARHASNRFLSPAEFRAFWHWLVEYQRESMLAPVALLMMATGQRTEEILRIRDRDFDRERLMLSWDATKNGLPHSIPLPAQAVEVLNQIPVSVHGLFFPSQWDASRPAGYEGLADVITRFREAHPEVEHFSPRDIRRTWKTLAGEAGLSKEIRDRLQNHARADVSTKHYDRFEYLEEKRAAMKKWSRYMAKVIEGRVTRIERDSAMATEFGEAVAP